MFAMQDCQGPIHSNHATMYNVTKNISAMSVAFSYAACINNRDVRHRTIENPGPCPLFMAEILSFHGRDSVRNLKILQGLQSMRVADFCTKSRCLLIIHLLLIDQNMFAMQDCQEAHT